MKTPEKQPVELQSYQFSSLPSLNDKILIFTRSHKLYLWERVFLMAVYASIASVLAFGVFIYLYFSPLVFLLIQSIIFTFTLTLCVREYLGWYFHFYLVTTRKIVEVCNVPFGKYFINEILLDRVKCTEVDIMSQGLINQILRVGDVIVTFDRPTHHRDSFIFNKVSNANSIREILTDYFTEGRKEPATWYVQDSRNRGFIYPLEELAKPRLHA